MNLEKLKDSARKFEQKEDWRKAIEVYLKAIQQIESGAETSPDLSLYNRVGDLYLKINDTAAAVRSYERAVDLYADQGFFNNAIALCGKILRVNPGRTQTYLKLAQLHARKNVVIEAKRNLIEFLERMNALGQLDMAFQSVKEFADQFSGSQEIRMMLVELLRAASREEEALEQLAKIAGDLEARGATPAPGRPAGESQGSAPHDRRTAAGRAPAQPWRSHLPRYGVRRAGRAGRAGRTGAAAAPAADLPLIVEARHRKVSSRPSSTRSRRRRRRRATPTAAEPVSGLEQVIAADLGSNGVAAVPGLELEVPDGDEFDGAPLEEIDQAELGEVETQPVDGLIDVTGDDLDLALAATEVDFPAAAEPDADLDLDFVDEEAAAEPTAGLPLIEPVSAAPSAEELIELEDRIVDDPENPDLHRELADRLLLVGDLARAAEELRLSLQGYERTEDWAGASGIADRLVALEPDAILHHQKRVELAFRTGERAPLLEAYLALGDALARAGATEKALAVYGRVHEHDPTNARATTAIAALTAPVRPAGRQRRSRRPPVLRWRPPAPQEPAARSSPRRNRRRPPEPPARQRRRPASSTSGP